MQPGVSVVIPAMDAAATLADTLRSVLSQPQLEEVIVVVQPSSDQTLSVAQSTGDPRVTAIADDGRGIARAMNIGIARARGRWFAKIDADDLLPEGRFAWQVAALEEGGETTAAVCGRHGEIDERGRPIVEFEVMDSTAEVTDHYRAGKPCTHLGTFLCRLSAVRAIGGFRPWFTTAEDLDFACRLAEVGKITFLPRLAYLYRLSERSITHQQRAAERRFFNDQARRFARQRQAGGEDDLAAGKPPALPAPGDGPADGDGASTGRLSVRTQAAGHAESHAWERLRRGEHGAALRYMLRSLRIEPRPRRAVALLKMALQIVTSGGRRRGAG
ncbi:MAG: glycosyltransferase [Pseudomonadota bacterium]